MESLTTKSIVVRVELHDGHTGNISEIARMHIAHVGFDYEATTLRNQNGEAFVRQQRHARFRSDRSKPHVWHLVARALIAMGYPGKIERPRPTPSTAKQIKAPTANQIKAADALRRRAVVALRAATTTPKAVPPCPVPLVANKGYGT